MISPDPCHRPPVKERLKKLLLIDFPKLLLTAGSLSISPKGRHPKVAWQSKGHDDVRARQP